MKHPAPLVPALPNLALLGALLLTLATLLGAFHWQLEILTHFRLPYALGYLLLLIILLHLRFQKRAALLVLALLPHLFALAPHYWPGARDRRPAHGPGFRLLAFNVLSSNERYDEVHALIIREDPDLIFLQEIDFQWSNALADLARGYPHSVPQTRHGNFGFLLLSKIPITKSKVHISPEVGSPFVIATLAWPDDPARTFTFAGAHPAPPSSAANARRRNATLRSLLHLTDASNPLILAGDFNCTPFSPAFAPLTRDLRQGAAGRGYSATWRRWHPLLGIPIDHILASDHWLIRNYRIGPKCGSDHSPLIADIQWLD
ncbi:endonuclease/exonuclease/phosphatase family protein [Roseibacillus ishigakijimensis]|uniref:Endonuclease/exonuclease/phosphatase family protein n=1 Tax=Roseibacillus ishigakijimensis TaxID=454146 RepID=A0A934RR10_9BACT|nr:endonuclease/exonuclease/phosphatase family protein [Roseibacillus ishigakijimensis]MBK1832680.1 endonuclease/exonuclease/phosphatase family protein [Roseibacillus ishigakijimensis]